MRLQSVGPISINIRQKEESVNFKPAPSKGGLWEGRQQMWSKYLTLTNFIWLTNWFPSNILKCIYDTLHCHVCDHRALSTKEVTKRNRPAAVSDRSLSKDVISSLPNQDIASLFENAFVNFDMTRYTCLNISYILMRRLTKNLTFPSLLLIYVSKTHYFKCLSTVST